jgi:3-oxoacyl-[acyl-carrier protein] reductase
MAPQDRLAQVSSHLNYPKGLLAGQTAIITGSGQGIGAECARLFANEGAKVVVCDIDASTPPPPPPLPVSVPILLPLPFQSSS